MVAGLGDDAAGTSLVRPDPSVRDELQRPVARQLGGDRGVTVEERLLLAALRQAGGTRHRGCRTRREQEDNHVRQDQRVGDPRRAKHRIDVADGNDHLTSLPAHLPQR